MMSQIENVKMALQAIRANMLRSTLTFSIIALGIMALVGILTSIDSIKSSLNNNFSSMGSNTFNVIRKGTGIRDERRTKKGKEISYQEAIEFRERYTFAGNVSVSALGTTFATIKYDIKETSPNISVYGIDDNYFSVAGYEIGNGRSFSLTELQNGDNVAILGYDIMKSLFEYPEKAVDKIITIKAKRYRVVGVTKSKGSSVAFAGDKIVFLPLAELRNTYGSQTNSYNISVAVSDALVIDEAIGETIGLFRQVRRLRLNEPDDFEVEKSDGLATLLIDNTRYLQLAAIVIGFITLAGAAIGLMNIMLVLVTERTREIGIRKSIGATKNNIMVQFLTEAIVICQIGGLLGILAGILVGNGVSVLLGGSFIIPWLWIILGFSACMVVGLIAGIYPALRAASLDPIEALRYE